ncbi:MAG: S41 family peptidase [Ilumatobacteraceae bacterium]
MQTLGDGIRRIHPNPFWRQSEAEFDASLAAAPEHLATLSDDDARAEVMRLMAKIDGHTGVYLGEAGFHLYAIHLYAFGDDIDVIAAPDPALIGATVLSIGGMPTSAAVDAVSPYSPFDNAATVELVVPALLTTPEVLRAAGVVDDVDAPHFVVRLTDGTERTVDPERLTWDEFAARIDPTPIGMTKLASIPALARVDEPFWTTLLDGASPDGGQTMYLQYNEVVRRSGSKSIDQLAEEIDATLSGGGITRLVVDLRYNPGGDDRTYKALLRVLQTNPALSPPGSLVVIIGRQTFSAAALFATELDKQTNVVFVGEPTGGRPNLFGNPRPLTLPNSGIVVEVSSKYFEVGGPDDHRDAIMPDVVATSGLDDLLAGRDPVLDAALALALA